MKNFYRGYHPASNASRPTTLAEAVIERSPLVLPFTIDFNWEKIVDRNATVDVEKKSNDRFGLGKKVTMTLKEMNQVMPTGDYYLTTQYPLNKTLSPPLTPEDVPLHLPILNQLIVQQINLWVGFCKDQPASSGLHHDFHDNLYILLKGKKTFHLYSPKDAPFLYTFGKILKIEDNGLIQYEHGIRSDGAYLQDVAEYHVYKAQLEIDRLEKLGLDTTDAEILLEEKMDACLEIQKPKKKVKLLSEPPSFSQIDTNDPKVFEKWPLLRKATKLTIEVNEGEALYLPCGWFHEVISESSNDFHMAVNYWMCPPAKKDWESPYEDDFWEATLR